MAGWEEWQLDYRLGVLLIQPPPEIAQQIDAMRAKYDPKSLSICSAHISVSDPLNREMTPELYDEIRAILSAINPFQLHFDTLQASTEHAGVYYLVGPQEPIDDLKRVLHRSTAFSGDTHERRDIPAHMTIAEFLSIKDGLDLCAAIQGTAPTGSFRCEELAYFVPDEHFCFRQAGNFKLGAA